MEPTRPDDVALGDHLRADETTDRPGTYRVVGVGERRVTLLRVGDGEGRRSHTGMVIRVPHGDLDGYTPVAAPTTERSFAVAYWSGRAFVGEFAARPFAAGAALAAVVAGVAGPVSAPLAGSLILVGSLLLAYVGGGRLRR